MQARRRRGATLPGPARTCIACRRTAPPATLWRLTRPVGGPVRLDGGRRQPGRGAYLCRRPECWRGALTTPAALSRAFRAKVAPAECTTIAAEMETWARDATDAARPDEHDQSAAAAAREEPQA